MTTTQGYDDSNLRKLFAEMDPKLRLKALKGGFRREAQKVRKAAISNLRASIRTDREMERGVRAMVFKRGVGFQVTIGSKKMKGRNKGTRNGARRYGRARMTWSGYSYHTNRQGKKKPVLIWTEGGTKWRKTKTPTRFQAGGRWKTSTSKGFMKRYGFMAKTLSEVKDSVTSDLHDELRTSVEKIAKKYGCI